MEAMPVLDAAEMPVGLRSRVADWVDDHLNPILVRDIRCWLRSKVFLVVFFVGLVLTQLVTISFTFYSEQKSDVGREMFVLLMGGMGFFLVGIMPYLIQNRLSDELRNRSTELALISRMTPSTLIRGKILSGMAAILVYFSAVGPSLLIAYMLGGFSLGVGVYGVLMLLFLSSASMILSLLFVTMHKKKPLRLLGIFSMGAGFFGSGLIGAVIEDASRGRMFADDDFWVVNIVIVLISVAAMAFFYTVATSRLSFEADNRDTRPRIALTVLAIVTYLSVVGIEWMYRVVRDVLGRSAPVSWEWFFSPALIAAMVAFLIGLVFVLDTPETVSFRIRSSWPRWGIVRTLYYPGRGRLYAFILAHFAFFLGVALLCGFGENVFCRSYQSNSEFWETMCGITFVVLCVYLVFGVLFGDHLLRRIFPKKSKKWSRGIIVATLFVSWSAIAVVIAVITEVLHGPKEVLLINPMTAMAYVFDRNKIDDHVPIALVLLSLPLGGILVQWIAVLRQTIIENVKFSKEMGSSDAQAPSLDSLQDETIAVEGEHADASTQDDPDEELAEQATV